jgi:Domain of unknown function (DUF4157)
MERRVEAHPVPKLDFHEREADHIADQAVGAMGGRPRRGSISGDLNDGARKTPIPAAVDGVLASPGQPLGAAERDFFQPRFNHDFSRVRVHSDAAAAASVQAVEARAYTVGDHIAFGTGQYEPGSAGGAWLLAHELAHVVQQRGGSAQAAGPLAATPSPLRLQRDIPPHMAPSTPALRAPYFHTDEALADLHKAIEGIGRTPPDIALAKAITLSVYHWLEGLVTSGRAQVAFLKGGNWLGNFDTCYDARNAVGEMYAKLSQAEQMPGRDPSRPLKGLLDNELARAEFARSPLKVMEDAVGFDLPEARKLPDVPTRFEKLTRAEMHVLAWLKKYRAEIAASAAKFKVDRRAVAGAIAWEGTQQVKLGSFRAFGPGKPHAYEFIGKSAVEEVEELQLMPQVSRAERERLLSLPPSAIDYVAAVMGALADIGDKFGVDMRNDPGVLCTVYHGWTPSNWKVHLAQKWASSKTMRMPRPVVANPMGIWVEEHIPYLEEAVGFTPAEETAAGEQPHMATPAGTTLHP